MDKEELQKNIALYYSKLSPTLQEVFSSMKWLETLRMISAKYNLNEKQIETLGTETTLVLLGMIHLDEYEGILKKELTIPKESLDKMLVEINYSILKDIRTEVIEAYTENTKPETKEEQEREAELDERFAKLPEGVQNAIRDLNYHMTLYKISTDHNLSISQMSDLETITTNVMLGITKGDDFKDSIRESLEIPEDKALELEKEITDKILKRIREKMQEVFSKKPDVLTPTETQKNDDEILHSSGIEIISDNRKETLPVVEKLELNTTKEEVKPTTPEKKEEVHPVLAQKLTGFVKNEIKETEHALNNLTKTNAPVTPNEKPKIPSTDPYREIPE